MKIHFCRWLFALLVLPFGLLAQSNADGLPPVTRTMVIKNAFVVQKPGAVIDMGMVIVRNGLIEAVGKNLPIPPDAKVLEGDSLYVYAGFIEGLSYTGVPKPKESEERPRVKDPGNPPNDLAGIQPERSVVEMLDAKDQSLSKMRKLGFTAAHVVPRGRMLPGKGAIIFLAGDSPNDMVLRDNSSLFSQFVGARRAYPATALAIMSKWRELYKQATQTRDHEMRYKKSPQGMSRPQHDPTLEAFYPVIEGGQSVFFIANNIKRVHQALTLQDELGFPMVLAELKQGWHAVDQIKDKNIPVILSMDLPKAKDKKKEEAKEEEKDEDPEKKKLEERRAAEMTAHESQAATMAKAGINFGLSTINAKDKDIRKNIQRMIENGLTEDQALAALTTNPAAMLGVSNMLGTVEAGKIANLVVSNKPYFEEDASVKYVMIDGHLFEYEVKEKKKGDPNAKVEVAGTWNIEIDVPGNETSGTLELIDNDGSISGSFKNEDIGTKEITNVNLEGSTLTFSFVADAGGQDLNLDFELVVEGNNMEGSVAVGNFGSFDVEADRSGTPD